MNIKIGDFVHYRFGRTEDYSIVTAISEYDSRVTGIVIEALTKESEKTIGHSYDMNCENIKLVTDENLIHRLNKIMTFK